MHKGFYSLYLLHLCSFYYEFRLYDVSVKVPSTGQVSVSQGGAGCKKNSHKVTNCFRIDVRMLIR